MRLIRFRCNVGLKIALFYTLLHRHFSFVNLAGHAAACFRHWAQRKTRGLSSNRCNEKNVEGTLPARSAISAFPDAVAN